MGYKLCTAEKPSVATEIARVIGANSRKNGYFEGNGYLVTWAVGHLITLAEPEAYGYLPKSEIFGDLRDQAYSQLPLLPQNWKFEVIEKVRDQYEIVKELMHRPDVDYIIDCGDMGPEGHILQWLIREKAGCTKPVKRFCATSMTDEAIREAMSNLVDADKFLPVIRGELCKKKADWMLGLSMSRVESLKYNAHITVGRVQSPTLAFVVSRYMEVRNFVVSDYYTLSATLSSGGTEFKVFWKKDTDGKLPMNVKDNEGRCKDKDTATAYARRAVGGTAVITKAEKKKRGLNRPQLYDILELQREANRRYGYSAAETLLAAQALYETQKVLTYPRTDSRYITSDIEPYLQDRVNGIATISKYTEAASSLLKAGLNIDKKIVDDSKVTDHHAIIPTSKIHGFDPSAMEPTKAEATKGLTGQIMRDILDLVLTRVLVSLSTPCVYEQTDICVELPGGLTYTASGKKMLDAGWKNVEENLLGKEAKETSDDEDSENAEQLFPNLMKGQSVSVCECHVVPKKTSPPKLHTEDTLLSEMKNAGNRIENGSILKGKGIGTQATRAEIIKGLFDSGTVENEKKGKTNYIKPTEKGMSIIRVLPAELYSPKITADWEMKIAEIVEGKITEQQFLEEFVRFLKAKVEEAKETEIADVSFFKQKEVFAICPWCGSDIFKWQEKSEKGKILRTKYYCTAQKDKTCGLSISSDDKIFRGRTQRSLTAAEAKRLITRGAIEVSNCKRKENGEPYAGRFILEKKEGTQKKTGEAKTYCTLGFEFIKKKPSKKAR